jgi:hypothetical protein
MDFEDRPETARGAADAQHQRCYFAPSIHRILLLVAAGLMR